MKGGITKWRSTSNIWWRGSFGRFGGSHGWIYPWAKATQICTSSVVALQQNPVVN